jgi:hypothetical protein
VFLDELPGFPPRRGVDFSTKFMPRVEPISLVPYKMSKLELLGLKRQIQELLVKGYINSIFSPWRALALSVKKDITLRLTRKILGTSILCQGLMISTK